MTMFGGPGLASLTLAGAQSNNPQTHLYPSSAPAPGPSNPAPPPPGPSPQTQPQQPGGGTPTYTGPSAAQIAAANAAKVTAQHEADFNSAKNTAYGMIGTDQDAAGNNIRTGINDFLYGQQQGQTAADREAVQNALAEQQGRSGVLDMVGQGIRSSNVQLANSGSANSSGEEALARAYGIAGRTQMSTVDNQYAQGQYDVANKEQDLSNAAAYEQKKLDTTDKATAANSVINDAVSRLAYLNQQAQYMSIPDRIAVDQEKQRIYDETMGKLGQFDQVLSQGLGGIKPMADSDVQKQAHDLLTAGTAPASSYNYTTIAPPQLQGNGPAPGNLPIFVGDAGKKNTLTGV